MGETINAGNTASEQGVHRKLTEEEARAYISRLTFAEKIQLNELLKALEQKRRPFPTPRE